VRGAERGLENRPCRCVHVFFSNVARPSLLRSDPRRPHRGPVFATSAAVDWLAGNRALRTHAGAAPALPNAGALTRENARAPCAFHRLAAHSFVASRYVMHRIDRGECHKAVAFGQGRDSALLTVIGPTVESQRRRGRSWRLSPGDDGRGRICHMRHWPFNFARKVYYGLQGRRVCRHHRWRHSLVAGPAMPAPSKQS
jgi:hypothetical protein